MEFLIRSAAEFARTLQQTTGFAAFTNRVSWLFAMEETLHFIGLSLLIGAVGIFDLRLLGMAKEMPVAALQRLLPWGVLGFVICFLTGVGFVLGNPFNEAEYLRNIAFLWKMSFILLAGINLLVFHLTGLAGKVKALGPGEDAPPLAKVIGAVSLGLWVGVIFFGRFLPVLGDAF